jgi:hypothetical protein
MKLICLKVLHLKNGYFTKCAYSYNLCTVTCFVPIDEVWIGNHIYCTLATQNYAYIYNSAQITITHTNLIIRCLVSVF